MVDRIGKVVDNSKKISILIEILLVDEALLDGLPKPIQQLELLISPALLFSLVEGLLQLKLLCRFAEESIQSLFPLVLTEKFIETLLLLYLAIHKTILIPAGTRQLGVKSQTIFGFSRSQVR